ncbi:BaiN/RdsA family NAD(P)/FAD-dependent oxidoreductase, partial [Cesiribacter andamanensis]|uniref:NAD(P)/FAD-dependent oxidoreductase n=1 Tax=Cesiribacter andamanensis TaxID=649507 RepID=UPI00058FD1C9
KTSKLLAKVKISGGGRCNVTHHCFQPTALSAAYPRGQKLLKQLFRTFGAQDTVAWFAARGVQLHTEADGRMFPLSNSSQTIISCFLNEAQRLGIHILTGKGVQGLERLPDGRYRLKLEQEEILADRVLITTGGAPKEEAYRWLEALGHSIEKPVPSLFTFNIPDKALHQLAGIAVPQASVRIETTKLVYEGPLLITHWGLSGPAILKLSAFGARWIQQQNYHFAIQLRWVTVAEEEALRQQLQRYGLANPKQKVHKYPLFDLPSRLWVHLCQKAGIGEEERWLELGKKSLNRLLEVLYRDRHTVAGKTTFKEEFVTCGGIRLSSINPQTMESRVLPGVFFAGEVLDIDGITGGFNFQAAWTTAWIAGSHV